MRPKITLLAALLGAVPLVLEAQAPQAVSYRCTAKDGKKYVGQTAPPTWARPPPRAWRPPGRRASPPAPAR